MNCESNCLAFLLHAIFLQIRSDYSLLCSWQYFGGHTYIAHETSRPCELVTCADVGWCEGFRRWVLNMIFGPGSGPAPLVRRKSPVARNNCRPPINLWYVYRDISENSQGCDNWSRPQPIVLWFKRFIWTQKRFIKLAFWRIISIDTGVLSYSSSPLSPTPHASPVRFVWNSLSHTTGRIAWLPLFCMSKNSDLDRLMGWG